MKLSNKKINNGRSMIEMLGVLALMAILSLVGVYMLQRSMLVHRTNQLVEDMRLAGMVVLDGLYDDLTTQEMSIKGHFEQQTPYTFTAALEEDSLNNFVVVADGVPFDVCVAVKDKKPNWAETVAVNGEEDVCHETENNFVSFFFNDELVELMDSCSTDAECGECGKCKNNRCKYGFKGGPENDKKCFDCDDSSDTKINFTEQAECNRCKDRIWRYWGGQKQCLIPLTHELNWWADVPKGECERNPKRHSILGGDCFYCEGVFDPVTGLCSTAECIYNKWGKLYGVNKDICDQCNGEFHLYYTSDGSGRVGRCILPQ